jgi:NAD-reducing hydrogenase small subunit
MKKRLATLWLDGCSGCHMSFLDMDERILEIADKVDLVYSPLVDAKVFPEADVALVEGAVSSSDDLKKILEVRRRCKLLVALGDCAVTGNVPAMRNPFRVEDVLKRAYVENATLNPGPPRTEVPELLAKVRPVHGVVPVDVYLPGCPPSADAIHHAVSELIEGRIPDTQSLSRFGA